MRVIDEFDSRTTFISSLRHSDAETRLSGLYKWLLVEPATKLILDRLASKVDVSRLLEGAGNFTPPKAASSEEIASVGIQILGDCDAGEKVFRLTYKYGVRPPISNYNFQDQLNEFLDRFIAPTLHYIREQLTSQDELNTPADYLWFRLQELLEEPFQSKFPDTTRIMEEITTQLGATESSESWFNVANSCREAMKSFTTELSRIHEFSLDPDTKAGDVKAILKAFIREEYSTGRYVDTLLSFVESVWDHLQSLLHRKSATRDDATRVFVWTYMLMLELNNLLVQRH